ncbi:hypothetical protein NEAUS05_1512 [Nematocida ausubeli]|nr:hypothetical protein NEAUS05_1512 [Nematocida ausubeli]
MDTVVVVFERLSALSLKSLSKHARNLLFPLRIFPVQMENAKIIKRWALTKTDKDYEFVEKEERCETLKSFIEQLRINVCMVFVDTMEEMPEKWHFHIDTMEHAMRVSMQNTVLERLEVKDTASSILQASNIFFKRSIISLIGIRIKNKSGKKETVDISIGLDKTEYPLPSEMSMVLAQPTGILVHGSHAIIDSKLLLKVLSKNSLFFCGYAPGIFLKLDLVLDRPVANIYRGTDSITILDSSLPFMKRHFLQEYISHLLRKFGEDIRALVSIFSEKTEKKDMEGMLLEEMKRIRMMSIERKNRLLLGMCDILSTLHFKEYDPRHNILASMHIIYADIIKKQKIEGVDAPICMHLPPTRTAPSSSLHCLLKGIEM